MGFLRAIARLCCVNLPSDAEIESEHVVPPPPPPIPSPSIRKPLPAVPKQPRAHRPVAQQPLPKPPIPYPAPRLPAPPHAAPRPTPPPPARQARARASTVSTTIAGPSRPSRTDAHRRAAPADERARSRPATKQQASERGRGRTKRAPAHKRAASASVLQVGAPGAEAGPSRAAASPAPADDEAYYASLRLLATAAGGRMGAAFAASHEAYARGERGRAKELSEEGKAHRRDMERLHARASEWMFSEKNTDRGPGEVDLHGQYVKEAVMYTERALEDARQRGLPQLKLIVGKGLHSQDGDPKLMPAIRALVQKQGLIVELDPKNGGVLVVKLDTSH